MTMLKVKRPQRATTTVANEFFLGRQPIVGRNSELFAYELLFRSGMQNAAVILDDVIATATVIKHVFCSLGMQSAIGDKFGFINVSEGMLMSDIVEALPRERVVLEVLEHVEFTPEIVARCEMLKDAGYSLALDDVTHVTDGLKAALPYAQFVKIDIAGMGDAKIADLVGQLRPYGVALLAEKVETLGQYQYCRSLGVDYFQGYHFAKPTILTGKTVNPSNLVLLQIFRLIADDAEIDQIENALKQAPDLAVRLLRMANSVGMRHINKAYSLRNALILLGRAQIGRVVQIMLFAQHRGADLSSDPLVQTAAVRGRLMEGMADALGMPDIRERAFMAGILSLADSFFSQSLSEILDLLNLDQELHDALLLREGDLGALLNLVEASEHLEGDDFMSAAKRVGLSDVAAFNRLQIESMRWASRL